MRRRLCALLILPQGYDVKAEPADKLVRLASTLAAAEIRNRYAGRERDGLLHRVALAVVIDGVFVRLVLLPADPFVRVPEFAVETIHRLQNRFAIDGGDHAL
jgi:hypothetical protein